MGSIDYPLLSDWWPHGATALKYGVMRPDGRSHRSIFIVDKEGKIRYIDVHFQREQPDLEAVFEVLQTMEK